MSWFRWQQGRQGTGYRKLVLFQSKLLSCDAYIIDYPIGSFVPTHTDPVPGKRHYRLNICLWGDDDFRGEALFKTKRIKLFRPDIVLHSVATVSKRRLVFSVGWAIK